MLSKRDVSVIRDLLVDYIINAKDEYIKQIVIQRIITPLKIKGFNEYLFREYENGKDELYRWYVVNAIINDLDVTPANIERVNRYISERNTSDIGRFLYWIGKNKISDCLPYVEKLLNSPQEPVIATVIETLGLIGNQSTMKLIEPYLRSRNSIIRSMARKAITNLSSAGGSKEQQSSSKNMSPLITWLDQPAIEKTIKEYEDGFFFEYSIEIDSENLSELWNVLGKAIPFLNELDVNNIEDLNEYYFKTMHHEFAHILHQRKNYDVAFDRITEDSYVGSNWYIYTDPETGSSRVVTTNSSGRTPPLCVTAPPASIRAAASTSRAQAAGPAGRMAPVKGSRAEHAAAPRPAHRRSRRLTVKTPSGPKCGRRSGRRRPAQAVPPGGADRSAPGRLTPASDSKMPGSAPGPSQTAAAGKWPQRG